MRAPEALLWTFGTLSSFASAIAGTPLTDDDLRNIPSPGDDFDIDSGKLLAPILIPRVPGTPGQAAAQAHLVDFFQTNLPGWERIWHNSTSKTPATGDRDVPFNNLILRRDPPWARAGDVGRLTLVAHYDSKLTPHGFIGATDSAAPCAMLLHAARSLDAALEARWKAMEEAGEADTSLEPATGLQILFLDGEEAFEQWTDEDSLYGARALAADWERDFSVAELHQPLCAARPARRRIALDPLVLCHDALGVPQDGAIRDASPRPRPARGQGAPPVPARR
ncbi:Glutaminyl-peptide cyclotransferase [Beauveria bassiana D1-5]|uniref:Peptide hydrolase n=1 Tax=Beauveria bassiana D1-5 TaxID=1245745 RepID=A0A0A2VZP7_BEABA|nr:Glutaminyl-peptide cyclotransferase [Beauveria bassiana D1-5]